MLKKKNSLYDLSAVHMHEWILFSVVVLMIVRDARKVKREMIKTLIYRSLEGSLG